MNKRDGQFEFVKTIPDFINKNQKILGTIFFNRETLGTLESDENSFWVSVPGELTASVNRGLRGEIKSDSYDDKNLPSLFPGTGVKYYDEMDFCDKEFIYLYDKEKNSYLELKNKNYLNINPNNEKILFLKNIPKNIPENRIIHGSIKFGSQTYFGSGDGCEDLVKYFDSFYENLENLNESMKFGISRLEMTKYLFSGYIVDINIDSLNIEFPKIWPDQYRNENDNYFFYDKNRDLYFHLTKK